MEQKCQGARDLWSQLDALRMGMNYSKEDTKKPQVLIDDCYGESHPGSFHLGSWVTKPYWACMKAVVAQCATT